MIVKRSRLTQGHHLNTIGSKNTDDTFQNHQSTDTGEKKNFNKFSFPQLMEVSKRNLVTIAVVYENMFLIVKLIFYDNILWESWVNGQRMTLAVCTPKSSCTHSDNYMYQFSDQNLQNLYMKSYVLAFPIFDIAVKRSWPTQGQHLHNLGSTLTIC